jgi:hypothetical protein
VPAGEAAKDLDAAVDELAVGRMRHRLRLDGSVDGDAREVLRLGGAGALRGGAARDSRCSAGINRAEILRAFRLLRTRAFQTRRLAPAGNPRNRAVLRVIHGRLLSSFAVEFR